MQIGVHIVVHGLVQGVGFRYFVHRHATRLGITGWVCNRFSGEVELEAEGERAMIEEIIKEITIGPRTAHVKDLNIEWQDFKNRFNNFEIR
jgi:acylphosphatase